VHRFAYKEMMAFASGQTIANAQSLATLPAEIGINLDIIEQLKPVTDGDTSYEELTCIGLDPNTPDTMVGVIQIKKSCGYSGNPCSDGSREYVTFWADFDGNGTFETCLGTADVQARRSRRLSAGLQEGSQGCAYPRHSLLEHSSSLRQPQQGAQVGQPRGNADQHCARGRRTGR
jgi:hypothetical protein